MKAYHDKVEPYIERDISKIEVGDILVADGHVLNFQVINPFTGRPTRATLVGFLDWKSTALALLGILLVEAAGTISVGDAVASDENGKAVKAADSAIINGYALDDGADGQEIRILIGQ